MREVFTQTFDISRLLTNLQLEVGFKITPEDTLLIFDEIQTCPAALTSLKYFCEDAPEYAIAAAGSLLGGAEHQGTGFPVGKVDRMILYPMSFAEFLEATGNELFAERIAAHDWETLSTFHDRLTELLKCYYFVGGMPEAVAAYAEKRDFQEVRRIQKQLLADYADDFEKHSGKSVAAKIRLIWESIPNQLARENKKFIYSAVKESMRSRDLEDAMQWLLASGMIYHVHNVANPAFPLSAYHEAAFKAFFLDVGLLAAKANLNARILLDGNRVFQEFKGALAEQYVLQQLLAEAGVMPYYWAAANAQNKIDFLLEDEEHIVPVEVKAETNLQAKSLKFYCKKFQPVQAMRLSMGKFFEREIAVEENGATKYTLTDLPLYAVSELVKMCQR